jgi:hypothetical protein
MLRRAVLFSALVAGMGFPTFVAAQQAGPAGKPIKIDGVVNKILPGQGIVVDGKDGKQYGVGFNATSKVALEGTSGPDGLAAGSFVQFDVELNDKQEPVGDVKKIQMIDKSPINQPGVFSALGPDGKPGAAGKYFIRGTVKTNKDGVLNIVAGTKSMTVKLDPAVSIPVFLDRWQLAKPGDGITGDGTAFDQAGAPMTLVLGTRVMIKAVAPIETKKK